MENIARKVLHKSSLGTPSDPQNHVFIYTKPQNGPLGRLVPLDAQIGKMLVKGPIKKNGRQNDIQNDPNCRSDSQTEF